VNWSDESQRKMSTRITAFGTAGKIYADRQECQVYLRDNAPIPEGYQPGWNVRYTTELTEPVGFYLRGEEYTAQIDHFVARVAARGIDGENTFESAAATDRIIAMLIADARKGPSTTDDREAPEPKRARRPRRLRLPRLQPRPAGALSQLESGKGA
jgi:hypothetical protein